MPHHLSPGKSLAFVHIQQKLAEKLLWAQVHSGSLAACLLADGFESTGNSDSSSKRAGFVGFVIDPDFYLATGGSVRGIG